MNNPEENGRTASEYAAAILKAVGGTKYSWYSLGDQPGMRGALKTNNQRQNVSGVTYILY